MTLPDRITHCDECGWTGEVRETCPECELHERIRAADGLEIWQHACEMEDHLRTALLFGPQHNQYADNARKALKDWSVTKEAITNP